MTMMTMTMSNAADLPLNTVLEAFGDFFLKHCLQNGYDNMLRTLGRDMKSFIQNLDSLHALLTLTYDKLVAPSFRSEHLHHSHHLFPLPSRRTQHLSVVLMPHPMTLQLCVFPLTSTSLFFLSFTLIFFVHFVFLFAFLCTSLLSFFISCFSFVASNLFTFIV